MILGTEFKAEKCDREIITRNHFCRRTKFIFVCNQLKISPQIAVAKRLGPASRPVGPHL
jgi:hypothetical protein